MRGRHTRQRAAAIILVLWAIAILALMVGGMSFMGRQDLAISSLQRDRIVAHTVARAGVEYAIAVVMDDSTLVDTLDDYCLDDSANMRDYPLTGGTFSIIHGSHDAVPEKLYGAEDESAKLNINFADREQLMGLPDMTEPIAAAILDWRDRDEDPQDLGIERSYYMNLQHPYVIRNAPFRTVREMLLVRDVDETLFYGEDTNGNGLLDPNEDDGDKSPPMDNRDGRLDRGWFAYVTTYSFELNQDGYGQKRLNINSANESQLASRLYLEDWAAKSIVKAREEKKFEKLTDLLEVERARDEGGESGEQEDDINFRDDDEQNKPVTLGILQRVIDKITLSDEEILPGRININTAPREVLATLPGVNENLADTIADQRDAMRWFDSIGELLNIDGIGAEEFKKIEDKVTVRSSVFRIYSEGVSASGIAAATIECVFSRGNTDVPRIFYWQESMP